MTDHRRARGWLALMGVVTMLSGCGSALPRYSTWDDFTRATTARVRADATIMSTSEDALTVNGRTVESSQGSGSVALGPTGVSEHDRSSGTANGMAISSEVIILPDSAYTLVPPAQRGPGDKPYLKLDPNATDPLSLSLAAQVRASRETGRRIYCFAQLGTPEITDATPVQFEGQNVMLYTVRIDLTHGSIVPAQTQGFRQFGLTTMQSHMHVDGADRILDCTIDQMFPGGLGSYRASQRFRGQGSPVTITAPPADEVTTTAPKPP